jgi:hypothetical protein
MVAARITGAHIGINPSAWRNTAPHDYAARFLLGGLITVAAGLVGAIYGPAVGGLFLAFPAIFPASVTLVERHQRERKERARVPAGRRGRNAAALEASGAALGSLGLAGFGAVIWLAVPSLGWFAFPVATLTWCLLCFLLWLGRRPLRFVGYAGRRTERRSLTD